MSFFADFFHNVEKTESVILIEVGTSSVAGAYVQYKKGELPALLYTRRMPIEVRPEEAPEIAMVRALKLLGETLVREGAPILLKATGTGTASNILVSIDAPWQKTSVRMELYEEKTPFVFTKSLVNKILEKTDVKAPDTEYADESIIGTILNGYETKNPYGKKAHRVAIVVLTSDIDTKIAKSIVATLQSVYHTKHILPIAGDPLRYQAMRTAFPYERNALLIDATSPLTSIALIRKGLFVSIQQVPGAPTPEGWVQNVENVLGDLATKFPLPRTIFLLARDPESAGLQKALVDANLGKLWLSDNPPRTLTVVPSHFTTLVRQVTTAPPDLLLLLMTVYWEHRSRG